jgi:tetratricopeptide (TPR) repeat protein
MLYGPGARLGRFEILTQLGAGGMGEVYQAHDPHLDRRVAIKVLLPHLTEDSVARERLRREAMAAAALDDPFICKIHEIGEDGGVLFIVMEYVSGVTLRSRLADGCTSVPEALRIAGELAEALEEAHSRHFVHRDLKPANVMLTPQGHVKVMDFGLAKRLELEVTDPTITALTQKGMIVGTPNYMSPEQVKGEDVDHRSDLFSFGIVLCELFGGRNPFHRGAPLETVTAILRDPPKLPDGLPQGLMVVIRRLLAKSPAERYQTMKEARTDLARVTAAPTAEEAPGEECMPLIGRDSERAELLRALDQAMAGRGSLIMIGGEPGIGKTHLTRAILEEARRRGAFGVVGHCYEMEGSPPYVPFVEMLEYSARVAPPESFRYAVGDAAPEISKIVPELRRIFPSIPEPVQLPPEQQRRFLFNAYRDFSERAARVTPIVAVFEDLHWADEPTLLLLQHVAQTISGVPSLLIGTYRDVELDVERPFASVLETLMRERLATRITLRRLKAGGVEAMLGAMSGQTPPLQLARAVFAETEGNPFFVEEVFRHLSEEGKLFDESGSWRKDLRVERLEVPEGVRLVIGKRLKRLSEATRRVLTTAAVIGRSFSLRLLEELESDRPDAALEAMEEAERAQLVGAERAGREPCYRFTHELIRQTLAEALSLPRRQRLHARIGGAIEKVYAAALEKHAPAIAHHLYQAGMAAGVDKTLSYLLRAAGGARSSAAHEEALAHLDNALSLLEGESGVVVGEVLERRGDVLRRLGKMSDAVSAYERAIAMFAQAGEHVRAAAASVPLAWICGWTLDLARHAEVTRRALALLGESGEPSLRVQLLSMQGQSLCGAGLVADGLRMMEEAERMFTLETGADVFLWHAYGYWQAADFTRASEFHHQAAAASQVTGDLWAEAEIGFLDFWIRVNTSAQLEPGELQPFLDRAIRVGHMEAIHMLRSILDWVATIRGHLESVERSAQETLAFAESFAGGYRFLSHLMLAGNYDLQGHDREMLESLRRACESEPPCYLSGASRAYEFRTMAIRGDSGAMEALRHESVRMPVAGRANPFGAWWAMTHAVEGLAALGRLDEAAGLRDAAEEFLKMGSKFGFFGYSTRTAAGIAAACARDWSRAEEHHQRAIRDADTAPVRIVQPITRAWYAEMLAAQGDAARARVMLSEALALYESIGMPGYARRASDRLATL